MQIYICINKHIYRKPQISQLTFKTFVAQIEKIYSMNWKMALAVALGFIAGSILLKKVIEPKLGV